MKYSYTTEIVAAMVRALGTGISFFIWHRGRSHSQGKVTKPMAVLQPASFMSCASVNSLTAICQSTAYTWWCMPDNLQKTRKDIAICQTFSAVVLLFLPLKPTPGSPQGSSAPWITSLCFAIVLLDHHHSMVLYCDGSLCLSVCGRWSFLVLFQQSVKPSVLLSDFISSKMSC